VTRDSPAQIDSLTAELVERIAAIPGAVDVPAEAARQRIGRLARQFERVLATVAANQHISVGDLEALSTLARAADRKTGLTPTRMGMILGVSSGTITVRVDRLVRAGLVEIVAGTDARQRPVRLTRAGRLVWGKATRNRTDIERRLINDALTHHELIELNTLLGRLLARMEQEYGPAPRHDMTRGRPPHA
jgi:DNA-binding MarR family transcriptional regulator